MVAAILTGIIVLQLQLSVVEKKTVDNFHLQLVNERLAVTAATVLQTIFRRKFVANAFVESRSNLIGSTGS